MVSETGENSGPSVERKKSGRPSKRKPETLAVLRQIVVDHPCATLNELTDYLTKSTGEDICSATVRKGLKELGVVRHVASKSSESEPIDDAESLRVYRYTNAHRFPGPEHGYPSSLTDAEWALVSDLFDAENRGRPPRYSRRQMLDAIVYVLRGGISWRMLPVGFPPWHQAFKAFQRWAALGRFETMYDRLRVMWRKREGRNGIPTTAVIDSQSVKTSPQGGPKGYDAGKKVKGRKRHLVTDTLGLLLAVFVHTANIQDRDGASLVMTEAMAKHPSVTRLYTDSAYGGRCGEELQTTYPQLTVQVVRHPGNRSVGFRSQSYPELPGLTITRTFTPLPNRWVVERTNAWNDRPRRLTKDHDRTIMSSTAWIWLAEARRLVRRLTWQEVG